MVSVEVEPEVPIVPVLPTTERLDPLVIVFTAVVVVFILPRVIVPPFSVVTPMPVFKKVILPELTVVLPLMIAAVTVAPEVVSVEVAVVVEPDVSVVVVCPWARELNKSMTRVPSRDVEADTVFHGRRRGCDWVGSAKLMEP